MHMLQASRDCIKLLNFQLLWFFTCSLKTQLEKANLESIKVHLINNVMVRGDLDMGASVFLKWFRKKPVLWFFSLTSKALSPWFPVRGPFNVNIVYYVKRLNNLLGDRNEEKWSWSLFWNKSKIQRLDSSISANCCRYKIESLHC